MILAYYRNGVAYKLNPGDYFRLKILVYVYLTDFVVFCLSLGSVILTIFGIKSDWLVSYFCRCSSKWGLYCGSFAETFWPWSVLDKGDCQCFRQCCLLSTLRASFWNWLNSNLTPFLLVTGLLISLTFPFQIITFINYPIIYEFVMWNFEYYFNFCSIYFNQIKYLIHKYFCSQKKKYHS